MPFERLEGPHDPRVADYRLVTEPQLVQARGFFVAEGRLIVRRLIEDGRHAFRSVLVSDAAFDSLEGLLSPLAGTVAIYVGSASDLRGIAGYDVHRGCLAIVERPARLTCQDVLAGMASRATLVVLEGVTNADNVGGVFRNAAAFGAAGVLLSPTCCDPLYRKAIRTSMAATLRIPHARIEHWPEGLAPLRDHGFTIVALTPGQPSVTLDAFARAPRPGRIALLVGTEGDGLTPAAAAAADVRVCIPLAPAIDSLNLAVAAGIALHRLREDAP